jgi:hypothetical protein
LARALLLNRLGRVLGLDLGRSIQITDCSRDLQDTVMRPSAKALLLHRTFEQAFAVAGEFAIHQAGRFSPILGPIVNNVFPRGRSLIWF